MLTEGPLHSICGPYLRNRQDLTARLPLWDGARGVKGTAKVWRPTIILDEKKEIARVSAATGKYRYADWSVSIWHHDSKILVNAFFPSEQDAIAFMIHNTKELFK